MTLNGLGEEQAREFRLLLDKDVKGGSSLDRLEEILKESNAICVEVDDYISSFRKDFEPA